MEDICNTVNSKNIYAGLRDSENTRQMQRNTWKSHCAGLSAGQEECRFSEKVSDERRASHAQGRKSQDSRALGKVCAAALSERELQGHRKGGQHVEVVEPSPSQQVSSGQKYQKRTNSYNQRI